MASQRDYRRRPRIVDRRLQLALLLKAVLNWVLFTAVAFGVLLAWQFMRQPLDHSLAWHVRAVWDQHGVAFLVLTALLPVVVYDSFKFSHRLAGPMVRLRHTIHHLAKGEHVEPLKFRQRDYWHEVADDFNVLLARLQASETDGNYAATMGQASSGSPSPRTKPTIPEKVR